MSKNNWDWKHRQLNCNDIMAKQIKTYSRADKFYRIHC